LAGERVQRRARAAVESVQIGLALFHNEKARRWWARSAPKRDRPVGLTGQALESAVTALRLTHPEYVTVGDA
jgi:hypothetical protein